MLSYIHVCVAIWYFTLKSFGHSFQPKISSNIFAYISFQACSKVGIRDLQNIFLRRSVGPSIYRIIVFSINQKSIFAKGLTSNNVRSFSKDYEIIICLWYLLSFESFILKINTVLFTFSICNFYGPTCYFDMYRNSLDCLN